MSVSTHVLDAVLGRPAGGIRASLERRQGSSWTLAATAQTDADGRIAALDGATQAGVYRLTFDVEGYAGAEAFYPQIAVTFRITDPQQHHHVPLLLSPFAYSTYRGS